MFSPTASLMSIRAVHGLPSSSDGSCAAGARHGGRRAAVVAGRRVASRRAVPCCVVSYRVASCRVASCGSTERRRPQPTRGRSRA